jgi:hypothetical protein
MGKGKSRHIPAVIETIPDSKIASAYRKELADSSSSCSFSFKYLQMADDVFKVVHDDAGYYHKVIERLQGLSTTSVSDLMANRSSALKCHPIDWEDERVSRACFGILREDELCDKPYQISISKNKGRLHGFFTGDIFNIVWFDKDHQLYPGKGKK